MSTQLYAAIRFSAEKGRMFSRSAVRVVTALGPMVNRAILALQERVTDAIQSQLASIRIRGLDVTVVQTEQGHVLDLRYELASEDPHDRRAVYLNLQHCTYPPHKIELNGEIIMLARPGSPAIRKNFVQLQLRGRPSWDNSVLNISIHLHQSGSFRTVRRVPALVIPNSVPMLLQPTIGSSRWGTRPVIRVRFDHDVSGLSLAGIPCLGATVREGDDLIEAVVVRNDRVSDASARSVAITPGLASQLSGPEIERVSIMLGSGLAYFAGQLNTSVNPRIVAYAEGERIKRFTPFGGGACSQFNRKILGLDGPRAAPNWLAIGVRLATVWWSGGCRIHGKFGSEIQAAIALALAIRWLGAVEGSFAAEKAKESVWDLVCRNRGLRGLYSMATSGLRYPQTGRLALALLDGLDSSDGQLLAALQNLTCETWGMTVDQDYVLARLNVC